MTTITDALGGVVTLGLRRRLAAHLGHGPAQQDLDLRLQRARDSELGHRPAERPDHLGLQRHRRPHEPDRRPRIQTTCGYDAARRRTSVTYPGGSVGYGYDSAGERTQMTDPTGQTTYTYDSKRTSIAQ
jgi:YD repeat-containing protein